ncbi:MAG: hypothetical protein C5B54_03035 [Acidobacteria bacterium]|nr:MAG: hypothetical protein C5B54_03035 [Acidobacteriota bacterium]
MASMARICCAPLMAFKGIHHKDPKYTKLGNKTLVWFVKPSHYACIKIIAIAMSDNSKPKFGAWVNKWLNKSGFQIVRNRTLERLSSSEYQLMELAELKSRVKALETLASDEGIKNAISYAMKAHWRLIDEIEKLSNSNHSIACALCGHTGDPNEFERLESNCQFFGGKLLRHRCPVCGVIFGPQKMLQVDREMIDLEYRNLYRIYAEGENTESVIRTFMLLSPKKEGIYLDFGCGVREQSSAPIEKLREQGWNVFGFEPTARNSSEQVFSTWQEVEERKFDGIMSHNVLEHLLDPVATTARLANILRPAGRLVHATPCFEYAYEFSRFHVFFFTGRSPEVLASKARVKIIDWVRDGQFIACILQPDNSLELTVRQD